MKRNIIYIWLLLALWLAKEARAQQVPGISYDKARSFRSERIFLEPDSSNVERYANRVAFLDGFGREYVTIDVQGSPVAGYDIVQPFHYGKDGKTDRAYLPCALAGNYGKLPANPFDPENWQLIGQDKGYAFSPIAYEGRLSGRVTAQMKPGKAWHDAGKSMAYAYGYNTANEIKMLKTTSSGTIEDGGYYPAGILEKVTATDEDGRKAETFTDKDGKTILTRELLGSEWLETWYAYDEKGQLRYVFPPELTQENGFWENPEGVEKYAWRFNYDKEGRMVGQKVPGCEPVTYKYDPFYDRLLEMQDGALREKGESIVFTYDKQGRLQNTALVAKWEHGTSILYLEAFSYDSQGNNFVPTPGYSQDYSENTAGKMDSRLAYLIYTNNNTYVQTNYYYDSEGRIIQQVEKTLSRTTIRTDYKYDFPGNLVAVREAHTYEGKTDVVEQLMRYDERGRIKETSLSLNGTPCAKVYYTYDHAGRLAGKIAGKASQVFRYNAQGWLTEMEGSAFSYKLRYENPEGDTPARWNGNISEWEWKQGTDNATMYSFEYDGLERLTGAGQFKETENGWQAMENSFTEKGISYDRNGNILTLQRTANGNTVDDLSYSYNGNLLTGVAENIRSVAEGDVYAPGSSVSATFEYDGNGNLVKNGHLGLEFQYNCLNLPWYVKRDGKTLATFYYLGDGTKVQTVDSAGVARHYIGSLTYRQEGNGNLVLEEIAFDGGIVQVAEDGSPETFYCITDHLGSVRAMVDADGNAVERNDYYPFGAQHTRTDYPQIANRYKFNGKEREKAGGADWLDYGARRYDPALARWTTPDPLGNASVGFSPFAFCSNNPVNRTDPMGMLDDKWILNMETGILERVDGTEGDEWQFVQPVIINEEENVLFAGDQVAFPGRMQDYILRKTKNGYEFVYVGNDASLASLITEYQPYNYNNEDLKMRRAVMEGNSRVLKAAIANMERAGRMEPLTATNYWNTYGHTLGSLNIIGSYMSMAVGLSEMTGNRFGLGKKYFDNFSPKETSNIRNHNVFWVTPEGIVLPKRAYIPRSFSELKKHGSIYGFYTNPNMHKGFIETLRIDPATPPGRKGPNFSHIHLNKKKKHITKWPQEWTY